MATVQRKLVHKQFNSPIGLYSDNNIKSTVNREINAFSHGLQGAECDENTKPLNLANSAVLKLLEEEERQKQVGGVKRVTWPPEHEYQARAASVTRQSPAYQPQYRQPSPHPHYQNGGHYPSGQNPSPQNRQPSPAVNYQNPQAVNYPNQSYQVRPSQSPSHPQSGYQQPSYHQQSHQQPSYQQPGYQQQHQQQQYQRQGFQSPDHANQSYPSHPSYLPPQQSAKPPSCTAAFTGGISVGNKAQAPAKTVNPPNWAQFQTSKAVDSGYVQPQYQQQQQQSSQPHYESQQPSYAVNQNQNQQTYPGQRQQQYQYHQQQQQQQQSAPVQPSTQQPQYQTNQSVQPQPQKQYQPENNFYRQPSPSTITLRKELPTSQQPALVYASEPAAQSFGGGSNMRGDMKWPPEEVKRQCDIENEQRRLLALGPAFRPRRVNKDYTSFFQRHALNSAYPGYKAPPGTQHYGSEYPQYPQCQQYQR